MYQLNRGSTSGAAAFDIVVTAGSLGGLKALEEVLGSLPANFPTPILVLQHFDSASPELLSGILRARTRLRAKCLADGEILSPGTF